MASYAQLSLNENFNYGSTQDSLPSTGIASGVWYVHSGTADPVQYLPTGLTYTNYPSSGIGGAAFAWHGSGSRRDINREVIPTLSSGIVYTSYLLNVKASGGATADYFFHLCDSAGPTSSNVFRGKFWVKDGSTGGKFVLGLTKGATVASAVWSGDLDTNVTYIVVLKYVIIPGATNDSTYAYVIKTGLPASEPIPTLTATDVTQTDLKYVKAVCIRQGGTGTAAHTIDGIRVGSTWADVVVGGGKLPVPPVFGLIVAGTGQTTMNINWQKAPGYVDSTMTTLVFLKKGSAVTVGTPNKNSNDYIPNTNWTIGGTRYQNDTAAKCVFNADGNTVNITGLAQGTAYFAMVVCVRNADSAYSTPSGLSGITFGSVTPPLPVFALSVKFTSPTSADVSFQKDSSHIDSLITILGFVKKGPNLFPGTPTKSPNYYTANSNYTLATSTYENDSLAKCVFKGDTTKFTVTGLTAATPFSFMLLVVRDKDTVYSNATIKVDTSLSNRPLPISSLKFSNMTTNSGMLTWNPAVNYTDSNMTTLVFLKQGSAVNFPPFSTGKDGVFYTANSNFAGNGTRFEFDSAAKCVFNADSIKTIITGLLPNTLYHAVAFVVKKTDSSYYSNPTIGNGSTIGGPAAVTSLIVNGTGQNSALVKWNRPAGYSSALLQTLVFVKPLNPILNSTPKNNAAYYIANSDFSAGGTPFENDTLAKCVFNGDTNFVDVTGLNLSTLYHVLVYTVRIGDSVYSNGVAGNGSTFGLVPPPIPVVNANSNNTGSNTGVVAWLKDSMHVDSNTNIMVFAKKGTPINQGSPKKSANSYTADADFSANGTRFENDSLAKCAYIGDAIKVAMLGLEPATTYHFVVYVVRDNDSAWSVAKTTTFTTGLPLPQPVLNLTMSGVSLSSSKIGWTKPVGYNNATMSTLVFVKESAAVNAGTPTKPSATYTASSTFMLGTTYQNDSSAYTVYKGDTNFVNVLNLKRGITYHVLAYVIRDGDSIYSADATANGTVLPLPPLYPINIIASVNPTTGVPDSMNVKVRVRGVTYGYNQRTTGLQFVVRDATGGTTLFRNTGNFGYTTYAEGDSVEAEGSVTTFRGLAEINLDTIIKLGSGKPLQMPRLVSKVDESGENDLLRIDSVKFINTPPGGNWPTTSSNISVTNTKNDTIVLRVLNVSGLAGQPLPPTPMFSIIGLGVQFSTSSAAPFAFNGYQLFPRTAMDVIPVQGPPPVGDTLKPFKLIAPISNASFVLPADTSVRINFVWSKSHAIDSAIVPNYKFQLDTIGGNFSNPVLSVNSGNGGLDTTFSIRATNLAQLLLLAPGQGYRGIWQVVATGGTFKRKSDTTHVINLVRPMAPNDTLLRFKLLTPINNATVALQGDPSTAIKFTWTKPVVTVTGVTPNYIFALDTFGGNFTSPRLVFPSDNSGLDTNLTKMASEITTALGLTNGQTFKGQWAVAAYGGSFQRNVDTFHVITFTQGLYSGLNDVKEMSNLQIYPNPANDMLFIGGESKQPDEAILFDITGKASRLQVVENNGTYRMDVSFCMPGIYLLHLKYGNITVQHKVHINR